jgi:hypothetical protein
MNIDQELKEIREGDQRTSSYLRSKDNDTDTYQCS